MSKTAVEDHGEYLVEIADNSEGDIFVLVKCPICDTRVVENPREEVDNEEVAEHIATHKPEELGLDEDGYQYTPMADILIRLYGFDTEVEQ